jgi:hypothetical protein
VSEQAEAAEQAAEGAGNAALHAVMVSDRRSFAGHQ